MKAPCTHSCEWDKAELESRNNKALNAILNGVTLDEFRRISTFESAKEAWVLFEVTHEGTKTVKISKLQRWAV